MSLAVVVRALAVTALSLGLAACGNFMPFDIWVKRYNANVERQSNDLLLLNIVRAGQHMPLLFTGVQVVRGNGSVTSGVTVGGSVTGTTTSQLGTNTIFGWTGVVTPGASISATDGFNFDVAVLDTAEF